MATAKRRIFLEALAETGNVSQACEVADYNRSAIYRLRDRSEEFATAWDEALQVAADRLEQEARRRAVEGTEEPVFYQGFECGRVRKYSDSLLMFLLKAARPERFRERQQVDVTSGGEKLPAAQVVITLPDNGRGDREE